MPTCAGPPSTARIGSVGAEICHNGVGAREVMQGSSPPPEGGEASSVLGPPRCLPAPLMGRCAPEPSTYLTRPQERPAHAAAPARAPRRPGVGAQPAAEPAPGLRRPRVPELRRAAAPGHGAVGAGAGGAAAARAPGGGGAGAHPAALADRAVAPAPRDPPRSDTRSGPRARRAAAGDWSRSLGGEEAPLAPDGEGFGAAAGYLSRPGPWRQLARPGPPALPCPDAQHSILGSDLSERARPS